MSRNNNRSATVSISEKHLAGATKSPISGSGNSQNRRGAMSKML
jgi:hypothetical protein